MSGVSSSPRIARGRTGLWASFATILIAATAAHADAPHLVRDVNTLPAVVNSYPIPLGKMGGAFYFAGVADENTGTNGLYKTDGTAAGTVLLRAFEGEGVESVVTADRPTVFFVAGNKAYFIAKDAENSRDPWVTDGTPAGTRRIVEIGAGLYGSITPIGLAGTDFVFAANGSTTSWQLFRTDGTAAGTVSLTNFPAAEAGTVNGSISVGNKLYVAISGPSATAVYAIDSGASTARLIAENPSSPESLFGHSFQRVGNAVYFLASTASHGGEVARIDIQTDALTFVEPPGDPAGDGHAVLSGGLVATDDYLFFVGIGGGGAELWRTDGTWSGTGQVIDLDSSPFSSVSTLFSRVGNRVLFSANPGGIPHLWSSDGTAGGTVPLTTGITGVAPGYSFPTGTAGSRAYFVYGAGTSNSQLKLISTDGTPAGTRALPGFEDLTQLNWVSISVFGDDNVTFVSGFGVEPSTGVVNKQLFRYNVAANTLTFLKSEGVYVQHQRHVFADGQAFFQGFDELNTGAEPWLSDGTVAGTRIVANVRPETRTVDSQPAWMVDLDGMLYFAAYDGVHGREIWRSDGTEAGTQLAFDVWAGAESSQARQLFVWNGALYFVAMDDAGWAFWRATPTSTAPLKLASVRPYPIAGEGLFPQSAPCGTAIAPVVFNSRLYFAAGGADGFELWSTDGTPGGTSQVADLVPGPNSSFPCSLMVFNGRLFFRAIVDGGLLGRVYSTDGTAHGTSRLQDGPGALGINAVLGHVFNGQLYFTAAREDGASVTWKSDGTASGTLPLMGADAPPFNGFPVGVANNRLLLLQRIPLLPSQPPEYTLWTTDGTAAGTVQIPGVRVSTLSVRADRGYFVNLDDPSGLEPWVTDGTPGGTQRLTDLDPNGSSNPSWFVNLNGVVYFQATDPVRGPGIWRTNGTPSGTVHVGDCARWAPIQSNNALGVSGQKLFFGGFDSTAGVELNVVSNDRPVAANDSANAANGAAVTINVIANDADVDGAINAASVIIVTPPAHGAATVGANGVITYTPTAGYSGADSFTYSVADNQGHVSSAATVNISVTAAPPPPSGGGGNSGGGASGGGGGPLSLADLLVLAAILGALRFRRYRASAFSSDARSPDGRSACDTRCRRRAAPAAA